MNTERISAAQQRVEAGSLSPRVRAALQHLAPLVKVIEVKGNPGDDVCVIKFKSKNTRLDPNFLEAVCAAVRNIGRLRVLEATLTAEGRSEEATYKLDITRAQSRKE